MKMWLLLYSGNVLITLTYRESRLHVNPFCRPQIDSGHPMGPVNMITNLIASTVQKYDNIMKDAGRSKHLREADMCAQSAECDWNIYRYPGVS